MLKHGRNSRFAFASWVVAAAVGSICAPAPAQAQEGAELERVIVEAPNYPEPLSSEERRGWIRRLEEALASNAGAGADLLAWGQEKLGRFKEAEGDVQGAYEAYLSMVSVAAGLPDWYFRGLKGALRTAQELQDERAVKDLGNQMLDFALSDWRSEFTREEEFPEHMPEAVRERIRDLDRAQEPAMRAEALYNLAGAAQRVEEWQNMAMFLELAYTVALEGGVTDRGFADPVWMNNLIGMAYGKMGDDALQLHYVERAVEHLRASGRMDFDTERKYLMLRHGMVHNNSEVGGNLPPAGSAFFAEARDLIDRYWNHPILMYAKEAAEFCHVLAGWHWLRGLYEDAERLELRALSVDFGFPPQHRQYQIDTLNEIRSSMGRGPIPADEVPVPAPAANPSADAGASEGRAPSTAAGETQGPEPSTGASTGRNRSRVWTAMGVVGAIGLLLLGVLAVRKRIRFRRGCASGPA